MEQWENEVKSPYWGGGEDASSKFWALWVALHRVDRLASRVGRFSRGSSKASYAGIASEVCARMRGGRALSEQSARPGSIKL